MADDMITVEVVYALPERQELISLQLQHGATAAEAIERSGLLRRFPEIDLHMTAIGIFGKVCPLERTLQDGERVEIYRPLHADPKDLRRQRAANAN